MGCVESRTPSIRQCNHPAEEDGTLQIENPEKIAEWAKVLLVSRSLMIDFRDEDNVTFYEESDFVAELMRFHNLFRNRHNAPELRLSQDLCRSAQSWANRLAHTGGFFHRNLPNTGECLFCKWNYTKDNDVSPQEVVEYWYRGSYTYSYDLNPIVLQINSSAFTQMVWVSTEEIGIGKARSREGKYIVVAHYYPAGNVPGLFHENVLMPSASGKRGGHQHDSDSCAGSAEWVSRERLNSWHGNGGSVGGSATVRWADDDGGSLDGREIVLRDIAVSLKSGGGSNGQSPVRAPSRQSRRSGSVRSRQLSDK